MKAKKILAPFLAGVAMIGVASCGTQNNPSTTQETTTSTTTSTETTTTQTTTTTTSEKKAALTQLTLVTSKATTNYAIGEEFSAANLSVSAVYADYSFEALSADQYTVDSSEFNNKVAGIYTIHVVYIENNIRKTASYDVTVASILDSLSSAYLLGINAEMKDTYGLNDQVDTSDLKVTAVYSDGSEKDVTSSTTTDFSKFDSSNIGVYMLKFAYSETYTLGTKSETKLSETFILATVDAKLMSIKFIAGTTIVEQDSMGPDGTTSSLDMSDWQVQATYTSSDYSTNVTAMVDSSDLVLSNFDSGMAGEQTATVSYTHGKLTKSTNVTITVNAIADPDFFLNMSDLSYTADTSLTAETTINDVIAFGNKCQVKMESSAKEYGTLSFTKRVQTNGAGKPDVQNYIKFTLDSAATVKIIGRASSASKPVTAAGFYNAEKALVSDSYAYSTDIAKYTYKLQAGTYYFYDPTYAVQVYGIQIWYTK